MISRLHKKPKKISTKPRSRLKLREQVSIAGDNACIRQCIVSWIAYHSNSQLLTVRPQGNLRVSSGIPCVTTKNFFAMPYGG